MLRNQPAHGQVRASNELRKQGIFVSPSGVRCMWVRHNLESFKKRLCALEAKVQKEGIILTEEQVAALERKKEEQENCGEIETLLAILGLKICSMLAIPKG